MGRIDIPDSLSDARARVEAELPAEERGLAKYAQLTRKETLLRADQLAALTTLARTSMRRRRRKVERITENTLIRIAIDLLLAHAEELRGSTEEELRDSVTSAPRDSQWFGVATYGTSNGLDSVSSKLRKPGADAASGGRR